MEAATSQRPQEADVAGDMAAPEAACLRTLVRHWNDAGAAVPVAIVVSVFDDVLLELPETDTDDDVGLDAIVVDDAGHAFVRRPVGLGGAGRLLVRALGDDVPSNAQPLVARLLDGDRPADAEQLRQWMRDALGAPASREEVCAAFSAVAADPTEAETLLPAPAPADTGDLEVASVSPEPLDDRVAEDAPSYERVVDGRGVSEASTIEDARENAVGAAPEDTIDAAPEDAPSATHEDAPGAAPEDAPSAAPEAMLPEDAAHAAPPEDALGAAAAADDDDDEAVLAPPPPVDEDSETLPPLPVPELADDDELYAVGGEVSLPPERHDTTIDSRPPSVSIAVEPAVVSQPVLDGADAVEAVSMMPPSDVAPIPDAPMGAETSVSDGRRVVRYEYSPPSVAVSSAPAARRSARAATAGPDSILVPNDKKSGFAWLVILAGIAGIVYVLFFR